MSENNAIDDAHHAIIELLNASNLLIACASQPEDVFDESHFRQSLASWWQQKTAAVVALTSIGLVAVMDGSGQPATNRWTVQAVRCVNQLAGRIEWTDPTQCTRLDSRGVRNTITLGFDLNELRRVRDDLAAAGQAKDGTKKLSPARLRALNAYQRAAAALAAGGEWQITDEKAFNWLVDNEDCSKLDKDSWLRSLRHARKDLGMQKKKQRTQKRGKT